MKITLFERHRNGATIEVKGDAAEAAKIIVDWRLYQDGITKPKNTAGFVFKLEDGGENGER